MDRVRNLLEQIKGRLEDLNKAERKVAEIILQNPQQATRFSIAALAQAASVSEPTVNRFCRSFGVSGYPELKLQLAQSLASGAAYVSRAVEADDNPEAFKRRLTEYREKTAPLSNYYASTGKLQTVDGMANVDKVTAEIGGILENA